MAAEPRFTDYDSLADRYDRRYTHYSYDGVRDTLHNFLSPSVPAALEVGCGTGHWLQAVAGDAAFIAGVEPSGPMLRRARAAAPNARLARGRAEALPWQDATFDRVFCVNALHHFADRARFFVEARRVLKPGGALLSVGKDPHVASDDWWVYDYFPETRALDQARFAPVRILRGELTMAGFAMAESFEAERIELVKPAGELLANGIVDRAFTSQLALLSDDQFTAGVDRIRSAQAERAADGGELFLISDFKLFATVGWV